MTCSIFTGEWICSSCAGDEFLHPLYNKARALEEQAMLTHDVEYECMGLPDDYYEAIKRERKNIKYVKVNVC